MITLSTKSFYGNLEFKNSSVLIYEKGSLKIFLTKGSIGRYNRRRSNIVAVLGFLLPHGSQTFEISQAETE
jgi:hypothetical protein